MSALRWGILGAGIIAEKMLAALKLNADCQVLAVASKTAAKAENFAERHQIQANSYEQLMARNDIDVIYIATTHNFHYDNAMQALKAGKHLLVEKPFTVNAAQAQAIITLAQQQQRFVMEAVWTRFLPSTQLLKQQLDQGVIGDIKLFDISFCHIAQGKYLPRLVDPNLAGGVTLDMGIYPITFVTYLLQSMPLSTQSLCQFTSSGVDETASYQMQFPKQVLANINTSFNLHTQNKAMIYGTEGYIEFNHFQQGEQFTLYTHNASNEIVQSQQFQVQNHSNGFIYQVAEVVKQIQAGQMQSSVMPLAQSLACMQLMDDCRQQWGMRYPFERQ